MQPVTTRPSPRHALLGTRGPQLHHPAILCARHRPAPVPVCTGAPSRPRHVGVPHRPRVIAAAAAAEPPSALNGSYAPPAARPLPKASLVLSLPTSNVEIHVFGVEHTRCQPEIGEFILRTRPRSVVVETAVCRDHGAVPGAVLTCGDQVMGSSARFVSGLCQAGAQLEALGLGVLETPYWEQMSQFYPAEQLAYIAAFSVGARLVHGDRPKDITYRRLAALATVHDLDLAFGEQCAEHFRDLAGLPALPRDFEAPSLVRRIVLLEREAIMCKVLHDLCTVPGLFVDPSDSDSGPEDAALAEPRPIVAVVGSAHVEGLKWLWESGSWEALLSSRALASSPLLSVPPVVEERPGGQPGEQQQQLSGLNSSVGPGSRLLPLLDADDGLPTVQRRRWSASPAVAGLRRGMLESLLRLSSTPELLQDLDQVLGPLTPHQHPAYDAVTEVYATSRMLLAVLPPDLLTQVCSGWNCDMAQVLEPLRQIRPVNGGPGYSDELIAALRALNYEL